MLLGQIPTRPLVSNTGDPVQDRLNAKRFYLDMIGYEPQVQEVWDFHLSDAPIRINSAPARTSKSYSGSAEIFSENMPTVPLTGSLTWIVGPAMPPLCRPGSRMAVSMNAMWTGP